MPAVCDSVLEDIEDIVTAQDPKPQDRRQFGRENIVPKVRKRNSQNNVEIDGDPPSDRYVSLKSCYASYTHTDGN